MGYGFVSLLQSKGNLGILDEVLLVRGLSSPAGHMSWTGLVCAVLWRERLKAGHATLNWRAGGAFFTGVGLVAPSGILGGVGGTIPVGVFGAMVLRPLGAAGRPG